MKVVTNATALIGLSRIGRLSLIKDLFGQVYVSQRVYDELVKKGKGKPGADVIEKAKWLIPRPPKNILALAALESILDLGEASTIVVGVEIKADIVILDEKMARGIAEYMGLKVVGTIGILIECKRRGLIQRVRPLLDSLRQVDFWIDEELYHRGLTLAREKTQK